MAEFLDCKTPDFMPPYVAKS